VNALYAWYCVTTTEVSGSLLSAMEEAAVASQDYPAEFLLLMHNGDGDGDGDSSSSRVSRVHGEREGMIPRSFSFIPLSDVWHRWYRYMHWNVFLFPLK
jgi:hypothetical protein